MKERDYWVDNVKVVACLLVVLGHFFQSMVKANIISDSILFEWFNTSIYYFHVPLFFICSGYLYQKYSKIEDIIGWICNVEMKALAFGIPYFLFSTITWAMKTFLVMGNNQIGSLPKTLFIAPYPPYWYLFCLFFIFLVTPVIKNNFFMMVLLASAVTIKLLSLAGVSTSLYFLDIVMENEIWFVLGMILTRINMGNMTNRKGIVLFLFFVVLSIFSFRENCNFYAHSFILGFIASLAIVLIFIDSKKSWILSKYTMPIFLMHTIFAAPIRIILLKLNITNPVVHISIGLIICLAGPIIASISMNKVNYLDFVLYPTKYIRFGK